MDTPKVIAFSKSKAPYGWMSNMSYSKIVYGGHVWDSAEHLFQALRFTDPSLQALIRAESNPYLAKQKMRELGAKFGFSVQPRSSEDLDNMRFVLQLKFEQHPDLQDVLDATGDDVIYEDVTRRGKTESNLFWGGFREADGTWVGENWLGRLLMERRKPVKNIIQKPLF